MAAFAIGAAGPSASFGGLNLEPLNLGASVSPYELSVSTAYVDGRLTAKWTYQSDLFSTGTIQQMARVRVFA